jgi:serine/threonine protein kinase
MKQFATGTDLAFLHEVEFLASVNHLAIPRLRGQTFPRPKPGFPPSLLFEELRRIETLDTTAAMVTVFGIASAIGFLHFLNVHLRIESRDILFTVSGYPRICIFQECPDKSSSVEGFGILLRDLIKSPSPELKALIDSCLDDNKRLLAAEIDVALCNLKELPGGCNAKSYRSYVNEVNSACCGLGYRSISGRLVQGSDYTVVRTIQSDASHVISIRRHVRTREQVIVEEFPQLGPAERKRYLREVELLSKTSHPAVVGMRGCMLFAGGELHPAIILDHHRRGTLRHSLPAEPNVWTPTLRMITVYGVAAALASIHKLSYAHRNVTPDAVFCGDQYFPILSGFDYAKFCVSDDTLMNTVRELDDLPFCPPELVVGGACDVPDRIDTYSFGLLAYFVITGQIPFGSVTEGGELCRMIPLGAAERLFEGILIPGQLRELLRQCVALRPDHRPAMQQVVCKLETRECRLFDVDAESFEFYKSYLNEPVQERIDSTLPVPAIAEFLASPSDFERIEPEIDSGAYSLVYRARDKRPGKGDEIVAMKVYDSRVFAKKEFEVALFREVELLSRLNHPTIVSLVAHNIITTPVVVLEYLAGGSLRDRLPRLDPTHRMKVAFGVASALNYLHDCCVLHRDLKPENILLDERGEPRIIDLNQRKSGDATLNLSRDVGTVIYGEVIPLGMQYTCASDIFSFGMLLYEIMTGTMPFGDESDRSAVEQKVRSGERPKLSPSTPYACLIERCWSSNADTRRTASDLVFALRNPKHFLKGTNREVYMEYVTRLDSATRALPRVLPVEVFSALRKY